MDEKGFMIRVIGKTKRVFDKVLYKERRFKQPKVDPTRYKNKARSTVGHGIRTT
jgi:hypothetical protein